MMIVLALLDWNKSCPQLVLCGLKAMNGFHIFKVLKGKKEGMKEERKEARKENNCSRSGMWSA